MKLTKRVVDAAKYAGKDGDRDIRWDNEVSGFGLRVYPTGRKAFVLSYRVNGRKRLMTLGACGDITAQAARKKAKKLVVGIDDGDDPLGARQDAAKGALVRDLFAAYLERHAKPHKKSWRDDERRINNRVVPAWGNLKAANIKYPDVAALHGKIGKAHPYEANRTIELISKAFDLAGKWGFVPQDFQNPAKGIQSFKEKKRDRWVTPEELPKLAQAIDDEVSPYARNALWLYLFTGLRKGELLAARWEDIDWDRKELRIPETKAGRVHYVPLSEPALAILRELPRLEDNPFILPGLKPGRHLVNINKPWQRVRKAAGVEDVRLHDLRRTVGSWLAQAGNSLHLIGRVLNHSNQVTTAVYARFGQDNVRQALEEHGQRIMGAAGKRPAAEVVDLEKVKR